MPQFSEDDVINFKITEAIVHRVAVERLRQKTVEKGQSIVKSHKEFAANIGLVTHEGR